MKSASPVAPTRYNAFPDDPDVVRFEGTTFESLVVHASDQELAKWANDPDCIEMELCAKEVSRRSLRNSERRKDLEEKPFDPRTEVSADAKHIANKIVMNLWIIFIVLPIV